MTQSAVVQVSHDNHLVNDILNALSNIRGWGSVEIFIQNHKVTQITERNIRKTQHDIVKATRS